jgi:hypothetical protein
VARISAAFPKLAAGQVRTCHQSANRRGTGLEIPATLLAACAPTEGIVVTEFQSVRPPTDSPVRIRYAQPDSASQYALARARSCCLLGRPRSRDHSRHEPPALLAALLTADFAGCGDCEWRLGGGPCKRAGAAGSSCSRRATTIHAADHARSEPAGGPALAGAANPYYAARTRRVSVAGFEPTPGQVITQFQSDTLRTDSPVRILYAQPRSRVSTVICRPASPPLGSYRRQ